MKLQENLTAVYNKSLNSLSGERWKEIHYTEGYYLISNYGRIKSLPRFVEILIPKQQRSICFYTLEKILTVKVREKWNHVADKPYYECMISIKMHGREKNYMIGRLVYNAFVKNIDFVNDRLMVMHKDEDELTGNEDEENNCFSIGGDNHNDLEEGGA